MHFWMLNTFMFVYGHLSGKVLNTALSSQTLVKRSVGWNIVAAEMLSRSLYCVCL